MYIYISIYIYNHTPWHGQMKRIYLYTPNYIYTYTSKQMHIYISIYIYMNNHTPWCCLMRYTAAGIQSATKIQPFPSTATLTGHLNLALYIVRTYVQIWIYIFVYKCMYIYLYMYICHKDPAIPIYYHTDRTVESSPIYHAHRCMNMYIYMNIKTCI